MKYLWAYSAADDYADEWNKKNIKRRKELGYDIEGFCLTPHYLNNRQWLPFYQLDYLWETGFPPLLRMYRELGEALEGVDVLVHYNGANIHPDILKELNVFKIYTCGDDPESTEWLSKPVAKYYDMQLVNNAACIDMYKSWGLKNVYFWPLGSLVSPEDVALSLEEIKNNVREESIVFIGERNKHKEAFLSKIESRYPSGQYWGKNWANGYISDIKMKELYYNSQIGLNLHNSSGPINFRLYELAAYGVMQICDNKEYLNRVFELDSEIVGYSTENECFEAIDYYLTHISEQREIALAAHERWRKDYTPDAVWRMLAQLAEQNYICHKADCDLESLLSSQARKNTVINKLYYRARKLYEEKNR